MKGLARRRTREREGLFLAEGTRVVADLLGAGIDLRLAAVSSSFEDTSEGARLTAALRARCAVRVLPEARLAEVADTATPQGVVVAAHVPVRRLEEVEPRGAATLLVLDAVQDPGNLGTLVRTAEALGVDAVVALPGTVEPWNPKVVRAAAGSLFRSPVIAADLPALFDWLARHGFALYAAEGGGSAPDPAALPQRVALAFGNEGAGLRAELREAAEGVLSVPLRGPAESLNVAVAAAILLYLVTSRPGASR